jgi:type VI protein secretion system component Hcp
MHKTTVALILALLACISYAYSLTIDRGVRPAGIADIGILTAIAKDDPAGAAYEMFLRVDTVAGQVDDDKHRNELSVDSFAWLAQRVTNASRPSMDGFRVTMRTSKTTPKLLMYTAGGTKFPKVVLSVRQIGSDQDFLKWILTDVQAISFKTVGNIHGDGSQDEMTFSFGKIELEYKQLLPDGTYAPAVRGGFDQRTNKSTQ